MKKNKDEEKKNNDIFSSSKNGIFPSLAKFRFGFFFLRDRDNDGAWG